MESTFLPNALAATPAPSVMASAAETVEGVNEIMMMFIPYALIGAGIYFCIRTLMVQLRMVPDMFRAITEKPGEFSEGKQGISAFKAFTISAAARVGTGNIAGVAVAITTGGPGAVFWMWMVALVGGATAFIESTLAQLYKVRDEDSFRGGPAYYMTRGLKSKPLAFIFAVTITFTYGFVFNAVQSNSIAAAVSESTGVSSQQQNWMVGAVLTLLTALIVFGGVRRIAAVTNWMVPIMAGVYIILGIFIVAMNIGEVPAVFAQIVTAALGIRPVVGASVGLAFSYGVQRGLFSNEAGLGSAPNAAATASVSHPVKQGLIQTLGVYFDTFVVCSVTAFIILLSNPQFGGAVESTSLTQTAVSEAVGGWGIHLITIIIFFLAFSSVIGNYYYGEANIEYFTSSKKVLTVFRFIVCLCVLGGALGKVALVWALADVSMSVMVIVNLIAIVPLCGVAIALLKHFSEMRRQNLDPIFHREDLPNLPGYDQIECWDGDDPITKRGDGYEKYGRR